MGKRYKLQSTIDSRDLSRDSQRSFLKSESFDFALEEVFEGRRILLNCLVAGGGFEPPTSGL